MQKNHSSLHKWEMFCEVHATLRFCGVLVPKSSSEVGRWVKEDLVKNPLVKQYMSRFETFMGTVLIRWSASD